MLSVTVKRGGAQAEAAWRFATWSDIGLLQGWNDYLGPDSSGNMRDSTDFARQAVSRWRSYADKRLSVDSLISAELRPWGKEERVALMVLVADWWFKPGEPLAFAYFRRTWCGSLYLEFMAGHPLAEGQVSGLLRVTLKCLAAFAAATRCEWIWWEATEESFKKYERVIGAKNFMSRAVPEIRDLFVVELQHLQALQNASERSNNSA